MYKSKTIGVLLLITHILSALTVGIVLSKINKKVFISNNYDNHGYFNKNSPDYNLSDLGNIFRKSIINSIKNILIIGGFIVLFAIIIEILNTSHILDLFTYIFSPICKLMHLDILYIKGTVAGIIELTNGLSIISLIPSKNIYLNIIISSFLLGFGGLSVLFQVWSIILKTDISIKPYILGKLLQGIISAFYTYIFINNFSFFNFNL